MLIEIQCAFIKTQAKLRIPQFLISFVYTRLTLSSLPQEFNTRRTETKTNLSAVYEYQDHTGRAIKILKQQI
jgi:hypothetical protein